MPPPQPRQLALQPLTLWPAFPVSNSCFSTHTDASFGTPPGYGCAADRAEEQRRHQDGLPYIDDSPSSSPHLGSKGRGALASGTLESTKAVSPKVVGPGVKWGLGLALDCCPIDEGALERIYSLRGK